MNKGTTAISDNLSDLSRRLKDVEDTYIHDISAELAHARNSVAGALPGFRNLRMAFGRVLRAYKEHYKAARGWTAAMQVIAEALGCDERTVERIIESYERASQLPAITLEEMEKQKIDPAAARNAPVVEKLIQMPQPANREEAAEAVRTVYERHVAKKRTRKRAAAPSTGASPEEFARQVVKLFEGRYRKMEPQQRDAEVRYVIGLLAAELGIDDPELQSIAQGSLTGRPAIAEAA